MKRILFFSFVALLIVALYYLVFAKDDSKNKGSISNLFVSEEEKYAESLTEKDIEKLVFVTLPEHALKAGFGGKIFCSNKIFGFDRDTKENTVLVYVYTHCEEYYLKADNIALGNGISFPAKIIYRIEKQNLLFDKFVSPKEGENYTDNVKAIFPQRYSEEIVKGSDLSTPIPSPKTQAENYYKGKLEVYF